MSVDTKRAAGRIYLLNERSELVPMVETYYESERILQELIAKYPDLLAGEQIDVDEPRRWLLVTREMEVESDDDDVGTWSLDHLFLDQDGVPTLVEVKRSRDSRIRRNVVGQMLDYGANAVVHWPVEKIIAEFNRRCKEEDCDPAEELTSHLGQERDAAEFWQHVKTNLEAGRIRMVFVADTIPPALRRIVEFLNEQMRLAEVLAIEVKQFEGNGVKTLVPRVFGQTESAREKKAPRKTEKKKWNEPSLLRSLEESQGNTAAAAAKVLIEWASPPLATNVWWGEGGEIGSFTPVLEIGTTKHYLFRITTNGFLVFRFDWLCRNQPFNNDAVGRELRKKIRELPAVMFPGGDQGASARIPLTTLSDTAAMSKVKALVGWLIETVRDASGR
jgi:hypothetical protein